MSGLTLPRKSEIVQAFLDFLCLPAYDNPACLLHRAGSSRATFESPSRTRKSARESTSPSSRGAFTRSWLSGSATLDGEELLGLAPDKRAKAGLFLSFQYPAAIPGVSVANFIRNARQAVRPGDLKPAEFRKLIFDKLDTLDMDPAFLGRYVNDGFSGGEKKRLEMLQLAILAPKYAVLDETDSGLDVDALQSVGRSVNALRESDEGKDIGFLVITHYPRILKHVPADVVHIMIDGRIVKTGGPELADEIERDGYDGVRDEVAAARA
jgi:Fe-S cluster assembly ATP-binding protein